jgi:hypothetical protein
MKKASVILFVLTVFLTLSGCSLPVPPPAYAGTWQATVGIPTGGSITYRHILTGTSFQSDAWVNSTYSSGQRGDLSATATVLTMVTTGVRSTATGAWSSASVTQTHTYSVSGNTLAFDGFPYARQ